MHSRNLSYIMDLVNQIHGSMDLQDADYYLDSVNQITRSFERLSSGPGLGHINPFDLLIQQEVRCLNACDRINDLNYKSALFLGICYERLPDPGGDIDYTRLTDHIASVADIDVMSDLERMDFHKCQQELLAYQGNRPLMLVRRWQARNDLTSRLGLGLEVSEDVVDLFEAGIQSFRPGRTQRPAPGPVATTPTLA